ncbi:hypothetical protein OAT67_07460 [Bacteriovoracaceae bacterium]|nr:hypothetical protein [Bacteriovoracaceae bacterium]
MSIGSGLDTQDLDLRKNPMKESLLSLVTTEAHSCRLYLERLHQAAINFSDPYHHQSFQQIVNEFAPKLVNLWRRNLNGQYTADVEVMTIKAMSQLINKSFNAFDALAHLEYWDDKEMTAMGTTIINFSYQYAHELHDLLKEQDQVEIQLPKTFFIHDSIEEEDLEFDEDHDVEEVLREVKDEDEEENNQEHTPLFYIDEEQIYEAGNDDLGIIKGIEEGRKRKYEQYLLAGHAQVANEDLDEGLTLFQRAKGFKETAEILTLIGWVFGLQNKIQKAKSYCLSAIQVDPDYGPPYNDLGNFLLNEDQVDESLKWFLLAKKATEYQNREHPYINCGRAYLAKRDYTKAMEEFSQALVLAPYNEELQETVAKIQKTLDRAKFDNTSDSQEENAPIF